MNTLDLAQRLHQEEFRPDVYSLDGHVPSYEGLILKREAEKWVIEYFERGSSRRLHSFVHEDEACAEMYRLLNLHFR